MINGKTPLAVVINTGAKQTVISRKQTAELDLPAGPPVIVHATRGAYLEPTPRLDDVGQ